MQRHWVASLLGLVAGATGGVSAAGCGTDGGDATCTGAPGTVCAIAGTGETAFVRDGMPATETAFYLPSEVRRGPDGLIYIMDFNNMRLRRIGHDGKVSTIAGDGFHAGATEGIAATESSLADPIDFDFLPDGRVVFVSYHDARVLMIDSDGTLQRIAGGFDPGLAGNEGDGGPADKALFGEIAGIAIAADGSIYLSDDVAHRIRVIHPDRTIETLAGNGQPGNTGNGGPAKLAALNAPSALAVDAAGNVYVSDPAGNVVRKIAADGTISSVAGVGSEGFSGDGGPAAGAALARPGGVAVASDGTLYIGDGLNHRVRAIAPDGTIATYAGTGAAGMTGNGGPASQAEFGYISRVQLDSDGGLLVTDQTNSCARKILAR